MNDESKGGRTHDAPHRKPRKWFAAVLLTLAVIATAAAPAASSAAQEKAGSEAVTHAATSVADSSTIDCSRSCMTHMVDKLLKSMVAHDPESLPLATVYKATENSHAAALGMMTLWRTVTKAGKPSLLAIDTTAGQAYLALTIKESGSLSVLYGRIKVVDKKITELELNVNRSRGDHGFTYSPEQLAANYKQLMSPPADREKATRAELLALSQASFDPSSTFKAEISSTCQFTEVGALVIDTGLDGTGSTDPLGCVWMSERPADSKARDLVIDEELGIVVTGGMVPGKVYPYPQDGKMISAFIPDDMKAAQQAQQEWYEKKVAEGGSALVAPTTATGVTLNLFQYYDSKIQAHQINVNLSGAGVESAWVE
ncbi:hypothetical protein [Streptomyces sp. YIM S03343]